MDFFRYSLSTFDCRFHNSQARIQVVYEAGSGEVWNGR